MEPAANAVPAPALERPRGTYASLRGYLEPSLAALEPLDGDRDAQVSAWRSLLPWPVTVIVCDANTVAAACVRLARTPTLAPRLATVLGSSSVAVLLPPHVPGELPRAMAAIARDSDLAAAARQVWTEVIGPRTRVVDLPVGEYLRPEIRPVAFGDGLGADPDDLPLAALAAFVPDSVIWSNDSVFSRVGLRIGDSVTTSQAMATLAISEYVLAATVQVGTAAGRGTFALGATLLAAARRSSSVTAMVLGAAALAASLSPQLKRDRLTTMMYRLSRGADVFVEPLAEVAGARRESAAQMLTYQPPIWRTRTVYEHCAGLLARAPGPLSASQLLDKLPDTYGELLAPTLARLLDAHPAFRAVPGAGWALGRSAL